jgi:hypothetical protein
MSRGLGKTQRAIIALFDVSALRTVHELAGSIYGTAETSVAQRQNVRRAARAARPWWQGRGTR